MKDRNTFIYIVLFVFLMSCEKEPYINFGFDSAITKNSNGLVIADISHHVHNIYLKGVISVVEGEVEVYLLNQNGDIVYSKTIVAPNEVIIDETFEAKPGYWKLKYSSRAGIGEIDLHIQKD